MEPAKDAADFLYIGELRHLKGVDVFLRALAQLDTTPGQGDPAMTRPATPTDGSRAPTAVIVGAGPDAPAFQALARELGLGDRVRFAGAMPARQAFALGRTLVVPSRAESFPYIVLEAAAAGLPMLATNVGGIPEILAGSGVAMVPPDDIAALAGALRMALERPAALASGARALRDGVGARFTVARMTESLLSFYNDASAPAGVASRTIAFPSRAH